MRFLKYILLLLVGQVAKYNIEVLPTLVVINNSVEICRFQGDLLFRLNVNKKEVQAKIDSIIISKFE